MKSGSWLQSIGVGGVFGKYGGGESEQSFGGEGDGQKPGDHGVKGLPRKELNQRRRLNRSNEQLIDKRDERRESCQAKDTHEFESELSDGIDRGRGKGEWSNGVEGCFL